MNAARFTFLDPRAQTFYRDWEGNARQIVALLRAEAGRRPYDRILTDLVGELATRSDLFRTLWASHDVRGAPHRDQERPPPRRRRPRPHLRGHGPHLRTRPATARLLRRARLTPATTGSSSSPPGPLRLSSK